MPKNQYLNPEDLRKTEKITFEDIDCNVYKKTVKDERQAFSDEDLINIYHDMAYIRSIETMLLRIKDFGEYKGIKYNYPGPSHLCIGQEAAVVGQAFLLDKYDMIFGSHRSHGEVLAKCLSAARKIPEKELYDIMKSFRGGKILKVAEANYNESSVFGLFEFFLAYGLTSEIFGRETGFNMGLGGSMHAFFPVLGSYPNNAIVGGSSTIATGAALFKKVNAQNGIVVANLGDGSLGRGPVWESMIFSSMDQYTQLWDDEYSGGLPIIFNIFNNFYGMGGQTMGETMPFGQIARLGAGVCPSQMYAERIDGYNPLAVIDAMKRKKELITSRKGPVLLDVITYRLTGHSASDSCSYRTEDEINAWKEQDALFTYREELKEADVIDDDRISEINRTNKNIAELACRLATDTEVSPRMDLHSNPRSIEKFVFSNSRSKYAPEAGAKKIIPSSESNTILPYKNNPRVTQIAKKKRFALDENGKEYPEDEVYQLRDGLFEAIYDKFYTDPTFISYSEEVRDWGGSNSVYKGLTEAIPYHRLFNSPISEAAIVGSAVGYAMTGGSVTVEMMFGDFLGCAGDEIFNQMAKWQEMSAGLLKMPVVLRVTIGFKYGAQHSQDWTSLISHIPGLKVVFPATPYDAKGLMNSALAGTDPVIFFESQRIYGVGEKFHTEGVPEGYYEIEIGRPDIKREGKDLTILTIGNSLYNASEAADILSRDHGISTEIIDARSLVPFDYDIVLESVKKTGRILLVSNSAERSSFLKDVAANITELAFRDLKEPPVVIGSSNWITPAYELEEFYFPQTEWILDAVHQKFYKLKNYTPSKDFSSDEKLRKAKKGV